jgi:predicted flap endonuclease-1-like 5' DNA nuclease
MIDERSNAAQPPPTDVGADSQALDELEVIEELDAGDGTAASRQTGERMRVASSQPPPPPGARTSAPPPVPSEARRSRPPSALPPPPPPLGRASVPPPQPPRTLPSSSPRSGMFRIDRVAGSAEAPDSVARPSAAPPPPSGASEAAELKRALAALSNEVREHASHIHRLRLMVRLREDRIRELEVALHEQAERAAALERELASVRAERSPDDLKRIAGIGPGFERALHQIGVTGFRQIAEWTPADVERVAAEIRTTSRRILRDDWVGRARALVDQP